MTKEQKVLTWFIALNKLKFNINQMLHYLLETESFEKVDEEELELQITAFDVFCAELKKFMDENVEMKERKND